MNTLNADQSVPAPWRGEWTGAVLVRRDGALQTTVRCHRELFPRTSSEHLARSISLWNSGLILLGEDWTTFFEFRHSGRGHERLLTFVWRPRPSKPAFRPWAKLIAGRATPCQRVDYFSTIVRRFLEHVEVAGVEVDLVGEVDFARSYTDLVRMPCFDRDGIGVLDGQLQLTCAIRGFPRETHARMLDPLDVALVPYRWVTRSSLLSERAAQRRVAYAHAMMRRYAPDHLETTMLSLSHDSLSRASLGFGELTTAVMLSAAHSEALRDHAYRMRTAWSRCGFDLRVETANAAHAWRGSLPGALDANCRRPVVSTINLAHILSVH